MKRFTKIGLKVCVQAHSKEFKHITLRSMGNFQNFLFYLYCDLCTSFSVVEINKYLFESALIFEIYVCTSKPLQYQPPTMQGVYFNYRIFCIKSWKETS